MKYYAKKLSDENIETMKRLHSEGVSYKKLGEMFSVNEGTVSYHLNPNEKADRKRRARKWTKAHLEKHKTYKLSKKTKYRSMCFSLIRMGLREGFFTKAEVLDVLEEAVKEAEK